jgi:hypothetical protein
VVLFALFGVAGGVLLQLFQPAVPPITTSFLLATGLAALTYRFLGGIQVSSVRIGVLRLGGTLAALVSVAMLINHEIIAERYQTYHVTGNVVDNTGSAINGLDVSHFKVWPPPILSDPIGNDFSIWFTTGSAYLQQQSAILSISNGSLSASIDLSKAHRNGLEIPLGIVHLNQQNSSTSAQAPTSPSYAGEATLLTPMLEKKP